jgi:hypothetical protein
MEEDTKELLKISESFSKVLTNQKSPIIQLSYNSPSISTIFTHSLYQYHVEQWTKHVYVMETDAKDLLQIYESFSYM